MRRSSDVEPLMEIDRNDCDAREALAPALVDPSPATGAVDEQQRTRRGSQHAPLHIPPRKLTRTPLELRHDSRPGETGFRRSGREQLRWSTTRASTGTVTP